MDETLRKTRRSYWNEKYRDYWMQRVAETNTTSHSLSKLNKNDTLTASDAVYLDAIQSLEIPAGATVLEMGCGFGRSVPYLQPLARELHAVDISEAMIESARAKYGHYDNVKFHISEAERTPFADGTFDVIVCFGVFDAVFQAETLVEMNRIVRPGGRILLTGKNDNYFDDDEEAYVAEIRAREKMHPNFFTDVPMLLKNLDKFGFRAVKNSFFLRRGDLSRMKAEHALPRNFYEYLLVFEKNGPISNPVDLRISDTHSLTWRRKNGETA